MHGLDQGHIELKLFVGGPAQASLRFSEMIQQNQQLLLGDRLAETRFQRGCIGWMRLADQDIAQQTDQIAEQAGEILAGLGLGLHDGKGGRCVAGDQRAGKIKNGFAWREAKDAVHVRLADRRAAERHDLVEHRLGIAHGSVGPACD